MPTAPIRPPLRRRCPNRRKSIDQRGPGFGYGFIVAMCFTLAFFSLLCGLVLDGFKDTVTSLLEANRESGAAASWEQCSSGPSKGCAPHAAACW
jgi:hypothetical protein